MSKIEKILNSPIIRKDGKFLVGCSISEFLSYKEADDIKSWEYYKEIVNNRLQEFTPTSENKYDFYYLVSSRLEAERFLRGEEIRSRFKEKRNLLTNLNEVSYPCYLHITEKSIYLNNLEDQVYKRFIG